MPRGDITARTTALILAVLAFAGLARASGPDPVAFRDEIRPFLDKHCARCHDSARAKGGIDFSKVGDASTVRKRRKLWRGVIEHVETLEMPPEGEPEVAPERRERVVAWLKAAVSSTDCDDPSTLDPGPPPVRRLTRDEYDRTLRDLLGVKFKSAEVVGMPVDGDGSGSSFANLAEALILPPALMEKYFAAADKALDLVFKDRKSLDSLLVARPGPGPGPGPGPDLLDREAARRIIARFLRLAYRRPVDEGEVSRYLALFDRSKAKGSSFEDSSRLMVKAALVSPHFLFRVERDRASKGSEAPYKVTDHELAVRLSYYLWSTMPDATLGDLADRGTLSDPSTLEAQVKRMLLDPKARALTDNFAEAWLQVGKLANARPSTEFFPTFNGQLRQALRDETVTFFDKLREGDRSVLELLDADYAYLNQDLAKHYDIPGVEGPAIRRVGLPIGSHRGGLLGMGSVLALTSHTNRTSPTLRGKYILEVVFGTPPPPPPPDAGKLPEGQEKPGEPPRSLREQMARHARQAECAACHAKIDPLGYGLENYDAVGRWRVDLGGKPLDATGKLPGGESFNGPDELKKIIVARKGDFERNLIERMLSYALAREVQGDDECAVRKIQADLERDGHRFSTLVLGVARSLPFLNRRTLEGHEPRPGESP
jgi:mono/diheme cytochrome c family protein